MILETAGLTYAEYARGGFFELVTVSTLLLPVLLGADWPLDKRNPRTVTRFRTLAATLLALIMLSAVQRMRLYVDAYGLTEDRFYATAFMAWIGVVLHSPLTFVSSRVWELPPVPYPNPARSSCRARPIGARSSRRNRPS